MLVAAIASCAVASTAMAGNVAPRDPLSNVAEFVEKNKVSEKTTQI